MYRWVVNDNPARNTRIMITICTPTMHDTIIRKMVRGSNIPWKCTFLFPLEVTFLPSSSFPFSSLSLSYSVRHDGSRFRSYTKIRTRSILRSKLIEFFRDSISRIIRRQVFNELLCTSRFRNLSINHHPRKRSLYTARDKGVDRQNRWDQSTTIHSPPSFSQSIAKRNLVVVTPGKELNGARRRVSRKEIVHFRHGTIDIIDEAWTSAASLESRETADLL